MTNCLLSQLGIFTLLMLLLNERELSCGIRELHNFLALHNPGVNAILKVLAKCYAGTVRSTPIKIANNFQPETIVFSPLYI